MSEWSYVTGMIKVRPIGRTQPEKRYILDTVLEHLPVVWGSEGPMETYVIQKQGHNSSISCDEFFERTDKGRDIYGDRVKRDGWFNVQNTYIIVVDGALRDTTFRETMQSFTKWLTRLSKRVIVNDVLVQVSGYEGTYEFNNSERWHDLFEEPSWDYDNKDHVPTWSEYLMWDRAADSTFPVMLEYKYFDNAKNNAEAERRIKYAADD